jgi:hypothetical protein
MELERPINAVPAALTSVPSPRKRGSRAICGGERLHSRAYFPKDFLGLTKPCFRLFGNFEVGYVAIVARHPSAGLNIRIDETQRPRFTCQACGRRGADVRPDFDWEQEARRARLSGRHTSGLTKTVGSTSPSMAAVSVRMICG